MTFEDFEIIVIAIVFVTIGLIFGICEIIEASKIIKYSKRIRKETKELLEKEKLEEK